MLAKFIHKLSFRISFIILIACFFITKSALSNQGVYAVNNFVNNSLTVGCLSSGDDKKLQAAINQAPFNGTYYTVQLCQKAVFQISGVITLKNDLQLITEGEPTDVKLMAMLVLTKDVPNATILNGYFKNHIRIASLHIDGQRREIEKYINISTIRRVELIGLGKGRDYIVQNTILRDSPGWTHLHLFETCSHALLEKMKIYGSQKAHDDRGHWSDGLSIACSDTIVRFNEIRDTSDAAIVYFGGPRTKVYDNIIIQEKVSNFAAINVGDGVILDHTDVEIFNNKISATPPYYFHSGITIGLKLWSKNFPTISGVSVYNNSISGMIRYGYTIDGCTSCQFYNNSATNWMMVPRFNSCPVSTVVVADTINGQASGRIESVLYNGQLVDPIAANVDGCLGPPSVLNFIFRKYAGPTAVYPTFLDYEVKFYSERVRQGMSEIQAQNILDGHWKKYFNKVSEILDENCSNFVDPIPVSLIHQQFQLMIKLVFQERLTLDAASQEIKKRILVNAKDFCTQVPAI